MDKRFAIFDMDGTLIDSMGYWKSLAAEFLASKGIPHLPDGLMKRIEPMTMTESAALFIQEFGLKGTPETLAAEMNHMMDEHYRKNIPLKSGVKEYLHCLQKKGVKMCVASATAKPLMEICLKRLQVLDCFEFLISCEEVNAGKNKPDIYLAAVSRLHTAPGETAVFEDALYAAKTAKDAGFYVAGVYDDSAAAHKEELAVLSDEMIYDWKLAVIDL